MPIKSVVSPSLSPSALRGHLLVTPAESKKFSFACQPAPIADMQNTQDPKNCEYDFDLAEAVARADHFLKAAKKAQARLAASKSRIRKIEERHEKESADAAKEGWSKAQQLSLLTKRLATVEAKIKEYEDREAATCIREVDSAAREAELKALEAELKTRAAELETREAEMETTAAELGTRAADIKIRTAELDTREAETNTREAEMNTREAEMNTREAEMNTREAGMNAMEAEMNIREAEMEARAAEPSQMLCAFATTLPQHPNDGSKGISCSDTSDKESSPPTAKKRKLDEIPYSNATSTLPFPAAMASKATEPENYKERQYHWNTLQVGEEYFQSAELVEFGGQNQSHFFCALEEEDDFCSFTDAVVEPYLTGDPFGIFVV
jgi:hypothetical protein